MSTWSTHIMGGDDPLDIRDDITEECGVDEYENLTAENLNEHLEPLTWEAETQDGAWSLVLGWVLMEKNAKMPPGTRALILKACNNDSWATKSPGRRETMQKFKLAVQEYPSEGGELTLHGRISLPCN